MGAKISKRRTWGKIRDVGQCSVQQVPSPGDCGGVDRGLVLGGNSTGTERMRIPRLVLVLDLDHTLLHSTRSLSLQESVLLFQEPRPSDVFETSLGFLTKLRPFVRRFLLEANKMYHLCICTMGTRVYAREMVSILDPDGLFFSPDDVICREDYKDQGRKGLDVVRHGDEYTTLILDDTPEVWEKHLPNLVPIPRYHFFSESQLQLGPDWQSLLERGADEQELIGPLWRALHLLRLVHAIFFRPLGCSDDLQSRDVRVVLRELLKKP